jgi:hypothetical protein
MRDLPTLMRGVCAHPAMYVGGVDYFRAVLWVDGYCMGRLDMGDKSGWNTLIDFKKFLVKKYGCGPNYYWCFIIDIVTPDHSQQEKLDVLLRDFEEFSNVLTRMAVEVSNGLEDA